MRERGLVLQIDDLSGRLREARQILLTTHQTPDGDGVGCQLAMLLTFDALGRAARIVNDGPIPPRFTFLPGAGRTLDWTALDAAGRERALAEVDLAVAIDTHAWAMLGAVGEALRASAIPTLFVDHHPMRDAANPNVFCDPEASSAGEVCWRLVQHLGARISPEAATCLYAAIAYDTNSFKYLRGRSEPHRAAAALIAHGADTEAVYRHVFASNSAGKVAFLSELLRSIQLREDGRVAWVVIPRALVDRTAVTRDDLRDAVTQLLEVAGVEVAIMFHERDDDGYKVSLRSKGNYPVSAVACRLEGGGHLFAAGAQAPGPLDALEARVFALVHELMSASGRAASG
jgi:bifunctional oligoribonuclease and PAP phosphatase NrnA